MAALSAAGGPARTIEPAVGDGIERNADDAGVRLLRRGFGNASSGTGNLWPAAGPRGIAPSGDFDAVRRLEAEVGYELAGPFRLGSATPYAGLVLADGGAREHCIGWRVTSTVRGDPGFEVSLDATRREAAGDDAAPENPIRLDLGVRF